MQEVSQTGNDFQNLPTLSRWFSLYLPASITAKSLLTDFHVRLTSLQSAIQTSLIINMAMPFPLKSQQWFCPKASVLKIWFKCISPLLSVSTLGFLSRQPVP